MGWFGSSSEQPEKPQEAPATEDGSYRPMKRNERKQCWEARDAFFACLDKNNILDAAKDKDAATRECGKQFDKYRQDCANSWVQYFIAKRVKDKENADAIKRLEAEGAVDIAEAQKPSWKFW